MDRLAIVGPGAMGVLFGYFLAPVFSEVVFLDQFPDRARQINRCGSRVIVRGRLRRRKAAAVADARKIGPVDLALVCVKSYDTASAVKSALPLIGKNTLVLSLQNGLGNLERIAEQVPARQILGGTTALAANTSRPGVSVFAGMGETVIGQMDGGMKRAKLMAEKFRRAGLPAEATANLPGALWSKAVVNAAINPLTALLRVRNGRLLDSAETKSLMAGIAAEAAAIAKAGGVRLLFGDPLKKVLAVAKSSGENISSMLQDVLARRRTEIDAINGSIASEAARRGLAAPLNFLLAALVRSVEKSYNLRVG